MFLSSMIASLRDEFPELSWEELDTVLAKQLEKARFMLLLKVEEVQLKAELEQVASELAEVEKDK